MVSEGQLFWIHLEYVWRGQLGRLPGRRPWIAERCLARPRGPELYLAVRGPPWPPHLVSVRAMPVYTVCSSSSPGTVGQTGAQAQRAFVACLGLHRRCKITSPGRSCLLLPLCFPETWAGGRAGLTEPTLTSHVPDRLPNLLLALGSAGADPSGVGSGSQVGPRAPRAKSAPQDSGWPHTDRPRCLYPAPHPHHRLHLEQPLCSRVHRCGCLGKSLPATEAQCSHL